MNILVLCPSKNNKIKELDQVNCFTDVFNYYFPKHISNFADVDVKIIPVEDGPDLQKCFTELIVDKYDAIITLGLRFYSHISIETTNILRSKFSGFLCQTHDGTRLDNDPVDITFTLKDDSNRIEDTNNRIERHHKYNEYMGWAADPDINFPNQSHTDLRILVDHTNYGSDNPLDLTETILYQIKEFVNSKLWEKKFKSVSVQRFGSGEIINVDLDNIGNIEMYDRTKSLPISEISKAHSEAHVFCVTHPESVGMVVLETAMAGALILSPQGFISSDRLRTVKAIVWKDKIDWSIVLKNINPISLRSLALTNSWDAMAKRVVLSLERRLEEKND